MTTEATIFIPDISGYTEFLSRTEMDHSSHIVNELLEILVEANTSDMTLSGFEGDALLFYKKGAPMSPVEVEALCVDMFTKFHHHLKVIERDTICKCGACSQTQNLTLKFFVHFGVIKESKVAHFATATGLDMIIAHRLMKNDVPSEEYILATDAFLNAEEHSSWTSDFQWAQASESYSNIGTVPIRYAMLGDLKKTIPEPPAREYAATISGDNVLKVENIKAPMADVYQALVDLENRTEWVPGLKGIEGSKAPSKLNAVHYCVFEELTVEVTPLHADFGEKEIRYIESSFSPSNGLRFANENRLIAVDKNRTDLEIRIGSNEGEPLPPEVASALLSQLQGSLDHFKAYCESEVSLVSAD